MFQAMRLISMQIKHIRKYESFYSHVTAVKCKLCEFQLYESGIHHEPCNASHVGSRHVPDPLTTLAVGVSANYRAAHFVRQPLLRRRLWN